MNNNVFHRIANLISKDIGNRGLGSKAVISGDLEKATRNLYKSSTILIVTGFCMQEVMKGETDGPLGAYALAAALQDLGKKAVLVTDEYSSGLLEACCKANICDVPIEEIPYNDSASFCMKLLLKYKPSTIVAIERPGRTKNGKCFSMRGTDLSSFIPDTDILFEEAHNFGIKTIAVGDGGNEMGMGKIAKIINEFVPFGELICAKTSADYLVTAGVSNWGGYGLTAALSILANKMLLHDEIMEKILLEAIVNAGSIDGCSKKAELTVDGFDLNVHTSVLNSLIDIVENELQEINEKVC